MSSFGFGRRGTGGAQTWAEYLTQMLTDLEQMSGERIDSVVEQGEQAYQELYDQALRAAGALGLIADLFVEPGEGREYTAPWEEEGTDAEEPGGGGGGGGDIPEWLRNPLRMTPLFNAIDEIYRGSLSGDQVSGGSWDYWVRGIAPGATSTRVGAAGGGKSMGENIDVNVNVQVTGNQNLVTAADVKALVSKKIVQRTAPTKPGGVG